MIIIHRCQHCRHPDIFHHNGTCSYSWCVCPNPVYDGAELIPTYTADGVVETITEPGTRTKEFGTLCNCEQCRTLYERELR